MNLSDCTVHYCPQREAEWFELRRGLLTASNVGPWLLKSDATSTKAREGMICKLIAEAVDAWQEPNFENAAMKRGTELEPQAMAAFEAGTGMIVHPVGFCRSNHGLFGCSPDGLIDGHSCGIEGKVPIPSTHIKYRRGGVLPSEYEYQVHASMAVTGARSWWFQSWNPGLAPFRIEVLRSDLTENLLTAMVGFSKDLTAALEEEKRAWVAANGRGEV